MPLVRFKFSDDVEGGGKGRRRSAEVGKGGLGCHGFPGSLMRELRLKSQVERKV